ncbi:hypothetical protein HRM2_15880 [Desulforapulum autotrophicum HRM2]|uniref:Uncharacterized protein n=1 Tax=Desulforapulum autotrophicum (strain ATCC 43914 / DSM 3382 / VKM B-1955 / HRM2) TaxID=177437 RepID=C0QAB2_DESAH|nr:hypothetical protein HRM2_15880 [Desulforapulum autotrophicum HRM2]
MLDFPGGTVNGVEQNTSSGVNLKLSLPRNAKSDCAGFSAVSKGVGINEELKYVRQ